MKIALVEDDVSICREVKILLENALYEVCVIEDFCRAAEQIAGLSPDLVLLDVTLPGISGFDICTRLRENSEVPVIFLTANTDSMSELTGMLKGGDDYIGKPFEGAILLARIAAVLKRTKKGEDGQTRLERQNVCLDVARSCIMHEGNRMDLTKNELKIMYYLFSKAGQIVSRVELIEYLWDNQIFIDDNTLSVHMTRVRGKLEAIGVQGLIETRRGLGYCIR